MEPTKTFKKVFPDFITLPTEQQLAFALDGTYISSDQPIGYDDEDCPIFTSDEAMRRYLKAYE